MPDAVPFKECNANFSLEGCYDLPAFRGSMYVEGLGEMSTLTTCWKFNTEELREINRTGCVWVKLVAVSPQPMLLCAFKEQVVL